VNLKKIGKVFTSKFVVTGPSSYKKRIYLAAVSQRLRNINLNDYRLNAIAITANLHWPYTKHLTLKNVTTSYQQQIFQPTHKAILLLCLILNM